MTFLLNKARCAYYTNFVSENCLNQRKLFSACKSLLNLSKCANLPLHSNPSQLANDFGKFFRDKINSIRLEIARQCCSSGIGDSHLALYAPSFFFSEFRLLSETEVLELIKSSTKTTCSLDPIPTKLFTECLDVLLTPITKLINLSLESGCFPLLWKRALVKPLLKKDGLDPIFKNYRPVSNLAYASKLVETVVAKQLQRYLFNNDLFPILQSAYRPNHSTETALLKVTNDILLNMNDQRVTLLLLLDLSAAFDTVDHDTLLHRLQFTFGVTGKVLSWFSSYLSGRSQQIAINDTLSAEFELHCGVPQGSCLGPLLFTLYSSKLFEIIKHHFPTVHCYADDTQVYISFCPNDSLDQLNAAELLESCIDDIRAWMLHDNLKLNDEKTELLIIGTPQQLDKVVITHIRVGNTNIYPVPVARNLGSWFDANISMTDHISKICSSSFYYLYNLRRIRKYLSNKSTESLVHAFISSRLDYCNSLSYGLPNYSLIKLQRVQNACARLIFDFTPTYISNISNLESIEEKFLKLGGKQRPIVLWCNEPKNHNILTSVT